MSRIFVSLTLVGALIGGFAFLRIGPIFGPININSGLKEYTDYDVQKALADRVAAERRAEEAALKRAAAEESAEASARYPEVSNIRAISKDAGEIFSFRTYGFVCRPQSMDEAFHCDDKANETECPRTQKKGGWRWFGLFRVEGSDFLSSFYIC